MIAGRVNVYREAVVRFPVRSPQGREEAIEAVIDTGFNGYLTLPPDLIAALRLPFRRNGRAVLGDGSEVTFDIHEAVILWDGRLSAEELIAARGRLRELQRSFQATLEALGILPQARLGRALQGTALNRLFSRSWP